MTLHPKHRRGFTLTELAIVLLVAGLVIGAIWVTAANVWNGYRVSRAIQQTSMSVMNIRDYYTNVQVLPTAGDVTAAVDALNLLPPEMRRRPDVAAGAGPIDHALNNNYASATGGVANGSFHVTASACPSGAAGLRCFTIALMGLTQGPCIKLLTTMPITDNELGIVKIGAQGMVSNTTVTTALVTPSTARGWCSVTGDTNEVDVMFRLHN